jgi:hypothetical protein
MVCGVVTQSNVLGIFTMPFIVPHVVQRQRWVLQAAAAAVQACLILWP